MRLLVILLTLNALSGCAVYTVASIGTLATTGKSIGDHGASLASGGDCNGLKHVITGKYYCEMPIVYNQSSF